MSTTTSTPGRRSPGGDEPREEPVATVERSNREHHWANPPIVDDRAVPGEAVPGEAVPGEPTARDEPEHRGEADRDREAERARVAEGGRDSERDRDAAATTGTDAAEDDTAVLPDDVGEERGRRARKPSRLGFRGWKDVLLRVRREATNDNVPLLSAGVALYVLLALVPALIAVISTYALVADPSDIASQIEDLTAGAPEGVRGLLDTQLTSIAESTGSGPSLGLAIGLAGALWSVSSGMKHLISAVNAAYDEPEGRNFLKLRLLSIAFTVGAIVLFVAAAVVIGVVPNLADELPSSVQAVARWAPYALLAILFGIVLALVYRFAPDRDQPRMRWVSVGAVVATVLWVAASIGFSVYVSNFGSYNETYGSLAGVVVLILWLLITAYAVLIGAELNSEIEGQTAWDTTTGEPRPMGERGAVKADELSPSTS